MSYSKGLSVNKTQANQQYYSHFRSLFADTVNIYKEYRLMLISQLSVKRMN